MSVTESSIIQPGTRVEIRRGPFPADAACLGRRGTVVLTSPYQPNKVGVTLDGEDRIRTFAPAELELLDDDRLTLTPDQAAAVRRLSRP